jgi:hypothetical protein
METVIPIRRVVAQRVDEIVDGGVEVFAFASDGEPGKECRPTSAFGSDDCACGTKCAQLRPKELTVDHCEAGVVALECGDDTGVRGIEYTAKVGPSLGVRREVTDGHVINATDASTYVKYMPYSEALWCDSRSRNQRW